MIKYLLAALVFIAVLGGAFYFLVMKPKTVETPNISQTQNVNQVAKVSPTPDTTDSAIDSDLTALERDLQSVDTSSNEVSQGVSGI